MIREIYQGKLSQLRAFRQMRCIETEAQSATVDSIQRIKRGEEIVFVYPYANPDIVEQIIVDSGGVGQFDLPLFRSDSMLHVKQYEKREI